MSNTKLTALIAVILVTLILNVPAFGRMKADAGWAKEREQGFAAGTPLHCLVAHRIGKIELAVTNNGTIGVENHPGTSTDWFTGQEIPLSCEYPKGSNVPYLFAGAFWIGAVVGRDTLVSVGADGWQRTQEMFPDEAPFGEMVYRSITDPTKPEFEDAISEEDYIAVYTDTFRTGVDADYFGRAHMPLNIEVTQSSFAWSYEYAEDFVLFDYQIKNIGTKMLENVYMGVYVDADVGFDLQNSNGFADDICGFLETYPTTYGNCEYIDTVFIAWIGDNDGELEKVYTDGSTHPCPHVTATRIVRTPSDSLDVSFNWWIGNGNASLDFGPRERSFSGRWQEEFRDYRTGGLGTPEGDVNKYYVLRNQEFDYDQVFTGEIQPNDDLWLYPNQELADDFADGYDTRYLLSFGPFDIRAGQTLPLSFAYVAGEDVHTDVANINNLPDDPETYYDGLDFSDLALNSTWASWVYDNPGVDTDGDEYFGKFRICKSGEIDTIIVDPGDPNIAETVWVAGSLVEDTFWYEGDGVPDFKGASPPPAPEFWLDATLADNSGAISVRFNGLRSETTRDAFSREFDFEGYRIYLGRDDRASSYSLVASYDRENYNKFVYNPSKTPEAGYELRDIPFTIGELRCLYGDSCGDLNFNPLSYTSGTPYTLEGYPDSLFYFEAQDYNASELGVNTPIRKIYPDQEYPSNLDPDSAQPGELTEDGYFKYFEYEFLIEDLMATVPFWVNVTAFDYGSPESGLASLETSVTNNAKMIYPQPQWDEVQQKNLEVVVYPNPYLLSGEYRDLGYEGRTDQDRPPDRTREIHFANLPPECTIKIFTLDGDLIREIEHNDGTPHEIWNLITRNTQLVVSGLYYWTVESEYGETQIGKLVIIM